MMRLYLGLKTRYSGLSTRLVISVTQLSVLLNTKNHLFVQSISSSKLGAQKLLSMNSVSDPDQDKIWSHKKVENIKRSSRAKQAKKPSDNMH